MAGRFGQGGIENENFEKITKFHQKPAGLWCLLRSASLSGVVAVGNEGYQDAETRGINGEDFYLSCLNNTVHNCSQQKIENKRLVKNCNFPI